MNVHSPKIQWKQLKNFDLSQLKTMFVIADFERKENVSQTREILKAILQNKFYDIVIRVVKTGSRYGIIDSQHRLQALYLAYAEHGVKTYDLMLAIYEKDDSRTIYRRLNLGKRLLPKDHLKALDDGRISFFNELSEVARHTKDNYNMSFVDVVNALAYATTGTQKPLSVGEYDDFLKKITHKEIKTAKTVLASLGRFKKPTFGSLIYQILIFRNIMKLAYDRNLSNDQIHDLAEKVNKNTSLMELSVQRKTSLLPDAYKLMERLL